MGVSPDFSCSSSFAPRSGDAGASARPATGRVAFSIAPRCAPAGIGFSDLAYLAGQEGYIGDPTVDLTEGGIKLLALRHESLEVEFQVLEDGEFSLLCALAEGRAFATACEQALAAQPGFDLPACFSRHILQGAWVDFHL